MCCSTQLTVMHAKLLQCLLSFCLSKGNLEVTWRSSMEARKDLKLPSRVRLLPTDHFLGAGPTSALPPSFLHQLLLSTVPLGRGHPFWPAQASSWLRPLPAPGAPQLPCWKKSTRSRKEQDKELCVSTALQQIKHLCVIHGVFIKKLKHSIL